MKLPLDGYFPLEHKMTLTYKTNVQNMNTMLYSSKFISIQVHYY